MGSNDGKEGLENPDLQRICKVEKGGDPSLTLQSRTSRLAGGEEPAKQTQTGSLKL